MAKLTLNLTDDQYAGLTYVAEKNTEGAETAEQYAQRIFSGACDSYAREYAASGESDILAKLKMAGPTEKQAVMDALASVSVAEVAVRAK